MPTLVNRLKSLPAAVTVSAFGFGYKLDTGLLAGICEMGAGTYGYIPDCSMVRGGRRRASGGPARAK